VRTERAEGGGGIIGERMDDVDKASRDHPLFPLQPLAPTLDRQTSVNTCVEFGGGGEQGGTHDTQATHGEETKCQNTEKRKSERKRHVSLICGRSGPVRPDRNGNVWGSKKGHYLITAGGVSEENLRGKRP